MNQSLTQENNRLKTQFQSQEDDRNFLILQLVNVKKDNEKLRMEYTGKRERERGCVRVLSTYICVYLYNTYVYSCK